MEHLHRRTLIATALSVLLSNAGALYAAEPAKAAPKPDGVIATVNGQPVTNEALTMYARVRSAEGRTDNPAAREALIAELINREVLYQEALAKKLDKTPEFEQQRRDLLAQFQIEKMMKSTTIKEEELRQFYNEKVAKNPPPEYRARHILVETEQKAKEIIASLDKGGDFAKLAKENSKDSGNKDKGGDLDWFTPQDMVPEFSNATAQLQKGAHTKTPVKTQFGWHIIKLDDSRQSKPPPFESVSPQIRNHLVNEALKKQLEALRARSKIEFAKQTP